MKMPNILVVDDEVEIVDSLSEYLSCIGYNPIGCTSVDEALKECSKSVPDLILSDIKMPAKSGLELFEQIKLTNPNQKIPVILMTSYGDILAVDKALNMGVTELISKPFDFDTLNSLLRYLISKSEKHADELKYFEVSILDFICIEKYEFDIYVKVDSNFLLVAKSGQQQLESRLKNLRLKEIDSVYLSHTDYAKYCETSYKVSNSEFNRPLCKLKKQELKQKLITMADSPDQIFSEISKNEMTLAKMYLSNHLELSFDDDLLFESILAVTQKLPEKSIELALNRTLALFLSHRIVEQNTPAREHRQMIYSLVYDLGQRQKQEVLERLEVDSLAIEKMNDENQMINRILKFNAKD